VPTAGNLTPVQANSDAAAPSYLAGVLLAAIVIAALASFAVIQEARQRGEVLDLVEVAPRSIEVPGDERVRIEWRQRVSSDDAVVRVIDTPDEVVRTLFDGSLQGDDTVQVFHWNGRGDSGMFAEPGRYRVEILLQDQDREIIPEQSLIRVRPSQEPSGSGEEG
jgi:flagellar hook assembly protein FlgD